MATASLTAVFEPVEGGWIQGRIVEVPGVITAAPSRTEAEELLADALREYLLSLQDDSLAPNDSATAGDRVALALVFQD